LYPGTHRPSAHPRSIDLYAHQRRQPAPASLDLEGTNFANCVLSQPEVAFSFPRVIPYVG